MALLEMPLVSGLYDYTERVIVEGVQYLFRFRWNTAAGSWYLDLSDADGNLIVAGRRCLADVRLLEQFGHLAIPPGVLLAFDTTTKQVDPTLDDFGARVLLLYDEASA